MSKKTLSALKYEIAEQGRGADSTENELKYLDKAIGSAMEDRVGCSARESLGGITRRFSLNMSTGLRNAAQSANALESGYRKTDALTAQADRIAAHAKLLAETPGEL